MKKVRNCRLSRILSHRSLLGSDKFHSLLKNVLINVEAVINWTVLKKKVKACLLIQVCEEKGYSWQIILGITKRNPNTYVDINQDDKKDRRVVRVRISCTI